MYLFPIYLKTLLFSKSFKIFKNTRRQHMPEKKGSFRELTKNEKKISQPHLLIKVTAPFLCALKSFFLFCNTLKKGGDMLYSNFRSYRGTVYNPFFFGGGGTFLSLDHYWFLCALNESVIQVALKKMRKMHIVSQYILLSLKKNTHMIRWVATLKAISITSIWNRKWRKRKCLH